MLNKRQVTGIEWEIGTEEQPVREPYRGNAGRENRLNHRVQRVNDMRTAASSGNVRITTRTARRRRSMKSSSASVRRMVSARASDRSFGTRIVMWISSITTVLAISVLRSGA